MIIERIGDDSQMSFLLLTQVNSQVKVLVNGLFFHKQILILPNNAFLEKMAIPNF